MIDWDQIDTVLLDMDGTLLDLNYDNTLWNHLLPAKYGERLRISESAAREALFSHMQEIRHRLEFYCLDYWASYTKLDVIALHRELSHLIQYRPGALDFLTWLGKRGTTRLLVTNAHRDSLSVKNAHSNLTGRVDSAISCHDYGAPKESPRFWQRLAEEHAFTPQRTLFIDDNHAVLEAAAKFGIERLLTIYQPDSARPHRTDLQFPAFNDFNELLPDERSGGCSSG